MILGANGEGDLLQEGSRGKAKRRAKYARLSEVSHYHCKDSLT